MRTNLSLSSSSTPPHTIRPFKPEKEYGGVIAQRYGRLHVESWEQDLALGFAECWRVLKKHGTLVFKWAECDKKIEALEPFFPSKPIFGSRLGPNNKTIWLVFFKT